MEGSSLEELTGKGPRLQILLRAFLELGAAHPEVGLDVLADPAGASSLRLARFLVRGPETAVAEPLKLAVFATVHGDEPAGAVAVLQLLRAAAADPQILRGADLYCYPICNPSGYEARTRGNAAGVDLNREFWRDSSHPEVRILEHELRTECFDGLVSLHADCDSRGLYAFARGSVTSAELVGPALAAACGELPRNTDAIIDGFRAEQGIIRDCYEGVLSPPPEQSPPPFEIILETPGIAPVPDQARAAYKALRGLLAELPRLSVGGGEI
jgi:murein peptide amidase A